MSSKLLIRNRRSYGTILRIEVGMPFQRFLQARLWPTVGLVLLVLMGTAMADPAPSFDCGKAHSTAEKAICADPWLAALDQALSAAYQHALQSGKVDKTAQAAWLRRRDADCAEADEKQVLCLRDHMQQRLAELQDVYGFAYGSASCNPAQRTASIAFDPPYIDPENLYNGAVPAQTFSWRCDVAPEWSVTVKYRYFDDRLCGMASIWMNGIKIARQADIGSCSGYVLKSATIDAEEAKVCYLRGPKLEESCDHFRRDTLSGEKDPYFIPGRIPGEPEPPAAEKPMHLVQGGDDRRCQELAKRLAVNWVDDMSDLALDIPWREVTFAHSKSPMPIAVAQFDIDNDGKSETVLRLDWQSHMEAGDRYVVLPADSWVRDLTTIEDKQKFFAALRKDMSDDQRAHPGKGYDLADPFGRTDGHYSVKALSIDGRTVIFARDDAEHWKVKIGDTAGEATRKFFEVEKSGDTKMICSFAPPVHLGDQL